MKMEIKELKHDKSVVVTSKSNLLVKFDGVAKELAAAKDLIQEMEGKLGASLQSTARAEGLVAGMTGQYGSSTPTNINRAYSGSMTPQQPTPGSLALPPHLM